MVDDYLKVYNRIVTETKTEDRRPWGYYEVLSDLPDHKVKRIVVYPGRGLACRAISGVGKIGQLCKAVQSSRSTTNRSR